MRWGSKNLSLVLFCSPYGNQWNHQIWRQTVSYQFSRLFKYNDPSSWGSSKDKKRIVKMGHKKAHDWNQFFIWTACRLWFRGYYLVIRVYRDWKFLKWNRLPLNGFRSQIWPLECAVQLLNSRNVSALH